MLGAIAAVALAAVVAAPEAHARPERPLPALRLVFASGRTGVRQVYAAIGVTGRLAQVTFGTRAWLRPVASPDGRHVAAIRESPACCHGELWVLSVDGRSGRRVAPDALELAWSPSSKRLAYTTNAAGVWSVGVAGGSARRETSGNDDRSPRWSPDGASLAFLRPAEDGWMLVVDRGIAERGLATGVGGVPAWSPDGRWIAIHSGRTVQLVRPNRNGVRKVADTQGAGFTSRLAWSPDGRRLAYAAYDGLHVVDITSLRDVRLAPQAYDLAWSPRGGEIAVNSGTELRVVTLAGRSRSIFTVPFGDALEGLSWSRPPRSARFRPAEPVPPLVASSGRELRARAPVRQLSADGDRVAYALCPYALGAWRPADGAPLPLGPDAVSTCLRDVYPRVDYNLALAGDRLAYMTREGGIQIRWAFWVTTLARRDAGTVLAQGADCCAGDALKPPLGYVLGDGPLLVFSTWERAQRGQTIWRVDDPGQPPPCTQTGACVRIGEYGDGPYEPLAVDGGRIVLRRWDGLLDIVDSDGRRLLIVHTVVPPVLGAELSGDDLVVLEQGQLEHYSVSTGALQRVLPLPNVPSGGYCGRLYCSNPRLSLEDAAGGVVLYRLDGAVHLLRLRDGADALIPGARQAELEEAGLFYAFYGEAPWPGRIRFVPFAELPLP